MMKRRTIAVVTAALLIMGAAPQAPQAGATSKEAVRWTDSFPSPVCVWSSTGHNDFFMLEPGDQATFEGKEGKHAVKLVITVLNDTKRIDGVETRIVEERELHDGRLTEVSRNYFAVCGPVNDIFYFGEDVDLYAGGEIVDHEGSWQAGRSGARYGLFMPSRILLGARFYQELAPGVAMDRVEIVSDSETLKTPAGEFLGCLKTEETTPLEPGTKEYKIYARGVGMIRDGTLSLTAHKAAKVD